MKDKTRYKDIIRMRKNRYSMKVIGEKYGISKQRVWQIVSNYKGVKADNLTKIDAVL